MGLFDWLDGDREHPQQPRSKVSWLDTPEQRSQRRAAESVQAGEWSEIAAIEAERESKWWRRWADT